MTKEKRFMDRHLLMALSNPVPAREGDFNAWFDNHHVPEVLQVPGFVSAERFRLAEEQRTPGPHPYSHVTVYELETDDLKATLAALGAAVQAGTKTDTTDPVRRALWLYTPVGPKRFSGNR
jgi:hypothetical protein